MNGRIIKTDTPEQVKETKQRIKEIREQNRKLPLLFDNLIKETDELLLYF